MADINYKRFINEIERSDERINLFIAQLRNAMIDYFDAMLDETAGVENDKELLAILAGYSTYQSVAIVNLYIKKLSSLYLAELKEMRPRFGVNQEDADLTRELAIMHQKKITTDLTGAITAIGTALAMSKALADTRPSRRELKEAYIEKKINQTEAELVTNVSAYRSSMEIRKANELVNNPKFAYIGPRDNKNRPICRYILDHAQLWTEKEIKELDKHPDAQLIPVKVYGGGYNCRHRWIYTERQ